MSLWNKILIGLIFVTGVAFFYMGARTLKVHSYWRDHVRNLEKKISEQEKEKRILKFGPSEEKGDEMVDAKGDPILGINDLRLELHKLLLDRGRVWYNCTPELKGQNVAVKTDLPNPHLIKPKTTLFLFEEKDIDKKTPGSGQYLGEFIVTGVSDRAVDMRPAKKMRPKEVARLSQSVLAKEKWCMYDVMPIDIHSVFTRFSDDEKRAAYCRALLPDGTVGEYLKDLKKPEKEDPKERIVRCKNGRPVVRLKSGELDPEDLEGGVDLYVRLLRDYKTIFESYHRRFVILADKMAENATDSAYVKATWEDAKLQRTFRQAEFDQGQLDLGKIRRESGAIKRLGDNYYAQLGLLPNAPAANGSPVLAKDIKRGLVLMYNNAPCLIESAAGDGASFTYRARNRWTNQPVNITLKRGGSLRLADVKTVYGLLAARYSANPEDETGKKLKGIYDVLSDPPQRKLYDTQNLTVQIYWMHQYIQKLALKNRFDAAEITRIQVMAANRINARTRAMARSTTGK